MFTVTDNYKAHIKQQAITITQRIRITQYRIAKWTMDGTGQGEI